MYYSEEILDQIFNKGQKNAEKMYRYSYGKTSSMGWIVDHKHLVAKGGSDVIRNLLPMISRENSRKSEKNPY